MYHSPHPLDKRKLGRSDIEVSRLSLGGAGLGGIFGQVPEAEGIAAVQKALELGLHWLDTSPFYKESERRMGMALRGVPREQYVLSSKAGTHPDWFQQYSAESFYRSVDNSLRLLGTDYLDLCLIHDPLPRHMDEVLGPGGGLEALRDLKQQGIIRAIGIGVRQHASLQRAIDTGEMDVALTFSDYTLMRQTALKLQSHAQNHGTALVNGAPLAMGLLSGQAPEKIGTSAWKPPQEEVSAVKEIAAWCGQRGITVLSLALQFSLRQEAFAATLIGASTPAEVEQSFAAVCEPIPVPIWEELPELLARLRLSN
ncbi:aldo/keto reductase [Paenibacillus aurantius]|uniref:Aldo/keto reductase n=1 Tax=Paenibacillus aurantius TaxID=2918900 RepID=A0AA96L829_9BACL|nr:aldo/keto reductase [Paenibacillus aurantius]WNQ08814.1 aldo/keto reductase [Paenibacillus aurantius]